MDKLQLIFFFVSGFLISRLIIKSRLPHRMVFVLIGKMHLSVVRIILYLVAISAFLSFFIPNAITVLTLLPVLELLRQSYEKSRIPAGSMPTMLALSTIYGANIGGMGSITATPANGILVTYAELNQVAGREFLNFAAWLGWGIPLVAIFVIAAWLTIISIFRPWRYRSGKIQLPFDEAAATHPLQRITLILTGLFFVSSLLLSMLILQYPAHTLAIVAVTAGFTLLFVLFLFFFPLNLGAVKAPLLRLQDCYNELPTRGFVFVGIAVVLAGLLYLLSADVYFARLINQLLPGHLPVLAMFLLIALLSSFSTEILSNTAVQISMFLIVLPLSATMEFSAIQALIIVTLSSTCAFMSPIATGVNGLAFGGVKDVSLARMLVVGLVMNTVGALIISVWAEWVIGWVFQVR